MSTTPVYIAMDVETGGLTPEYSLLSAYFAILDEDLNLIDELDILTKPDDGRYVVSGEALRVNGIDLASHDQKATFCKDAAGDIYNFLARNNPTKIKLIPLGHNVRFDIDFVCAHTLSKKSWDNFVGYRCMDTGTISQFLIKRGELPQMNASLGTIAAHYGYSFAAHTAKGDVMATIEIMKRFLNK